MILRLLELKCYKKFYFCLLLIYFFKFFCYPLYAEQKEKNPFNSALPSFPVSYSDSSFAPLINPVFSDISSSASISYITQSFEDEKDFNHFFLLNYAGFLFSYSWIDNLHNYNDPLINSNTKLFTIGKGLLFNNMFGIGANYSFGKSNNDNFDDYRSVSLGLLLRPVKFLSLGYTSRDINNPKVFKQHTPRSDVYSVSVRPFTDITISFDAVKYEGRDLDKSDMILSASLRFIRDISAYTGITKDKDFMFGLLIPLGINSSRSTSLIFDGYYSNIYGIRSSGVGVTLSGDKTRSSIIQSKRFLKITINEAINEIKTDRLFNNKELSFYDLLTAVKTAKEDDSIAGIILQIENAALGFAQIQELREELKIYRNGGKTVNAILNAPGNKEYYLATACDKIYFNPANLFAITGLKAEVFFFKEGLDKLGIKFESVARGPYKSYPEPYTKEHMSREFRENLTALISDLNEQYLNDIVKDRSISRDQINMLFKKGLMTPDEALDAGFIDKINYPLDAEIDIIKSKRFLNLNVTLYDYIEENERAYRWGPRPMIAVIYVTGSIVHGYSQGYERIFPDTIGDETYLNALITAFTDSSVKAVVIRVDSGGGSSLASELMLHNLIRLKKEFKKPVVFSFGNTAASGGYYIACTGDRILSSKGTITGSIGVVAGKLSLKELYSKLGINKDIIKMSEFADIFSESKDMSPAERKVIEQGVDYVYNRFKIKAAEARGIAKENIDKAAEGRVFTGNQAKNINLVDTFGGITAAIDMAKKIADIKDEYVIKQLPEISVPLINFMGLQANSSLLPEKIRAFISTLDFIDFNDEYALYYCPYKVVIK
jgi:protease IV